MFCPSCGNEVPDQVKFCPKCGRQLGQTPAGAPPAAGAASSGAASGGSAAIVAGTAPGGGASRPRSKKPLIIGLAVAAVAVVVAAVGGFMWMRTPKPIWSVTEVRQYQNLNLHAVPDWTPTQIIAQEHDEQGNVTLEAYYQPKTGTSPTEAEADYDENGACTEQRFYYYEDGERLMFNLNEGVEAEYDLFGRVSKARARDGSFENRFTYNLDGSLRVDTTMEDGSTRVIEYDAQRFMTRSAYTSETDGVDYEIAVHHEKDGKGRVAKATYTITDGTGEHAYDSEWTEYEYDEDGNLSTVTVVTGGVPWERWEMDYEYIEHSSAYARSTQVQLETAYFRAGDDWFLSRGYIAS